MADPITEVEADRSEAVSAAPIAGSRLFIETSIFIWRRNRSRPVIRRIRKRMGEWYCVTSTYVRAEYLATVLGAAVDLYAVLQRSEDVQDAAGRWRSRQGGRRDIGDWLLGLLRDRHSDREESLLLLRVLIEEDIFRWFDECQCELTDATECGAANASVSWNAPAPMMGPRFPPPDAPTGLRTFLASKRTELEQFLKDLPTPPDKHWGPIHESIGRVLSGRYELGLRKWQKMADLVIALEAHEHNCYVYTTNARHFTPVCRSLGIGVVCETASD
ncbi:MAG TPA: hypothetical protein VFJ58_16940 [Armatimonadota bacterium]|nr:hypothetical protein [Armatimonadota bacterium]